VSTPDNVWIAASDEKHAIGVLAYSNQDKKYAQVGRLQAHSKEIVGLWFKPKPQNKEKQLSFSHFSAKHQLFSISSDRTIVEYGQSSEGEFEVASKRRIEQTDIPTAITPYVPGDKNLYMSTDRYRLKVMNADTFICRETTLACLFSAHPLKWMLRFQSKGKKFLAYATQEKLIGLICLPFDGNPHRSMGVLAHPGKVYIVL
jgi:hypothetical protein